MDRSSKTVLLSTIGTVLLLVSSMHVSAAEKPVRHEFVSETLGGQPKATEWNTTMVDYLGYVGSDNSIAVDSNDWPHISYYDLKNRDLKYARWTGNGWLFTRVDSRDKVGHYSSIAIDSNDYPHITYYDDTNEGLKYANMTGGSWSITTVDTQGAFRSTSVALDSNDYPHILYSGTTYTELKYAYWNGDKWIIEIVDADGVAGRQRSVALDSEDNPHVSYYGAQYDLLYAKRTKTGWSIETVDSDYLAGMDSSIAVDSNDCPHISYWYQDHNDLRYAKLTGGRWGIETVDSDGRTGESTSIALDSEDNPHITYHYATTPDNAFVSDIMYASWTGTNWNIETVNSSGNNPHWSSLAIDSRNRPHVSFFEDENDDLIYASRIEAAPPERSLSLDIDPDTLNLKSRGKWITAYLRTEGAMADEIDASSLLLNDLLSPEWWELHDSNTLMAKFNRADVQAILPVSDSVDIKVTGQWKDGETFEVHDIIRVIMPGTVPLVPRNTFPGNRFLSFFEQSPRTFLGKGLI
jgi:hypothetical protein